MFLSPPPPIQLLQYISSMWGEGVQCNHETVDEVSSELVLLSERGSQFFARERSRRFKTELQKINKLRFSNYSLHLRSILFNLLCLSTETWKEHYGGSA